MDSVTQRLMMGAAGAGGAKTYIEDVFSTWLYTGNGSTQTITNGIDLSGKGGLVWIKNRSTSRQHIFKDSANGLANYLQSNSTAALTSDISGLGASTNFSFSSTGFSQNNSFFALNSSPDLYASWTFRKAAKFFDVVTGSTGAFGGTFSHNLGSVPGCVFIKLTGTTSNWGVYHRSLGTNQYLLLNSTSAASSLSAAFSATADTFSFDLGIIGGGNFVAYLFAHDAGGFGDSGNESVIKCGSYTGNGSTTGPVVDLGWEPQWVMLKSVSAGSSGNWIIYDTMRGVPVGSNPQILYANTSGAEVSASWAQLRVNPTGFQIASTDGWLNTNGETYIYIAIRRGPMKTPTDATKVFTSVAATSSGTFTATAGFPVDLDFYGARSSGDKWFWFDRVRGNPYISSNLTNAEVASVGRFDSQTSFYLSGITGNYSDYQNYAFRRAPGFFDVVCYAGTGSARTVSHNLGVAPQWMIIKRRSAVGSWRVGAVDFSKYSNLQTDGAFTTASAAFVFGNDSTTISPTSSVFSVGSEGGVNGSGDTYIAYLFASCPGVSKVGSYTGTGTTKQIDCGFTNGARFVLIKRTDSTGDWYVWDTARGIIAANDPYLLLNSAAAEVTNTDYIDPLNSGFEISSTAPAAINANGGTYIYLAIA